MDYYLSPTGSDSATGTLADPRALTAALLKAGGDYALLPGRYVAPTPTAISKPLKLRALGGSVVLEPAIQRLQWAETTPGSGVWRTPFSASRALRQSVWFDADGISHRLPLWNTTGPGLTSPAAWITTVQAGIVGPKWGAYSTATDLFLICPAGVWQDPNSVRIVGAAELSGLSIAGEGVELHGIRFVGHHLGVRLSGLARYATITDCTFRNCGAGIMDVGVLPATYGYGHITARCTFEDDGDISWYATKTVVRSAESVGYSTEGGSTNSTVEDCTFRGTFDGIAQYHANDRYGPGANQGLRVRRSSFLDIQDDSIDLSRWNDDVVFEDCPFHNVGTIISPAPLWGGSITLRRCSGSLIGEQARIPDSVGKRPPGSIIKCGAVAADKPPGTVRLERCDFWTNTPSTQGVSQDGGTGTRTSRIEIVDSTLRVPGIVVNWPYDLGSLLIERSTLACSGTRPLKPATLPMKMTPVAEVDARRRDALTMAAHDLQAQLAEVA